MANLTSPYIEAVYGWDYGSSGWNGGLDEDLLKFSYLFDSNIDGIVSTLPAVTSGTAYFNTADNRIYYAAGTAYHSVATPQWFQLTLRSTGAVYIFNGTALVQQVIDKTAVGLGNVDNTSDVNKPVSTAQATADALKVSKAGDTLSGALNFAPAVTLADSATPAVGAAASNTVILNGTTAITGFDTVSPGTRRNVRFNTARSLTYDSTKFILPTKANIYTAVGDRAEFISLGSGNWECIDYFRISGANVANITSKDLGAIGNGTTSDVTALVQANTNGVASLTIVGNCLIDSNLTINCPVVMTENSRFTINTGVTLTLSSTFNAPISQVFNCIGTGAVVFNKQRISVGYPEWWGALTNTSAQDCTAAIQACNIALPVTQLQAADYFIATSLQLLTSGRTMRGQGAEYYSVVGASTRIVSLTGSNHVLILGPSTQPATINDFPRGIIVENLQVTRAVAPVIGSGCCGVYSRWTLYQQLTNIKSSESAYGFQYVGTVQPRNNSLQSFRSIAGSGTGTDTFRGFFVDGTNVLAGVAGGNASCHWDNCVAGCVNTTFNSYGMYISGSWADTFVKNFESSACTIGVYLSGDTTATINYRTVDLHIINPIIDQFSFAGIFVDGTSPFGTISINGGYAAPIATGTPTGVVYINNSKGNVNITGGFQYICGPSTTMSAGLFINNSSNVDSIGNIVMECNTIPVLLSGSTNCNIMDRVINTSKTATVVAQLTTASNRNKISLSCYGAASKFTLGVQLVGSTNGYNEINCTGIDATFINGGSANKLVINGTQVTAVGLSGTNYASGVMA